MFWIFGYGSLVWDDWQSEFNCLQVERATLLGFSRAFNKLSVANWGTKATPGPTLNLVESNYSCEGTAFAFPEEERPRVENALAQREGRGFEFLNKSVTLASGDEVTASVPIYTGPNILSCKSVDELAAMICVARGKSGTCASYVTNIAQKLEKLRIQDAPVQELAKAVKLRSGAALRN